MSASVSAHCARSFSGGRVVPVARKQACYCQAHGFEQWLGRIMKGEPTEFLERIVTGFGNRVLVANVTQELDINVMTIISNNVAEAKYAKLAHF